MRKWKMEQEEFYEALAYLLKKVQSYGYLKHLEEFDKIEKAKEGLYRIAETEDVITLQNWVEKYLLKEQIDRLRTKLRVERSRKKKELRNITLDAKAHEKLANLAESYNVTLSKMIEIMAENFEKTVKMQKP